MPSFEFSQLHARGISSDRAAQLASSAGVPRLLILKALADHWNAEVKSDDIAGSNQGGYPSVAARQTATFGLAGLVSAYPDVGFEEFLEFESETRISMKLDALAMADRVPDALAFFDRMSSNALELTPLSLDECRSLAVESIDRSDVEVRIQDDSTQRHQWGWLFLYQSAAYLDTGDYTKMIAGNAPLIVDRFTGAIWPTGTAVRPDEYIQAYESFGTPHRLASVDQS